MSGVTEHLAPDDVRALSPADFAALAGVTPAEVQELREYQLLPAGALDLRTALALREAARLRTDFDLDLFATGLLAGYIRRVHELEGEVQRERAGKCASTVYTEVTFTAVEIAGRQHAA